MKAAKNAVNDKTIERPARKIARFDGESEAAPEEAPAEEKPAEDKPSEEKPDEQPPTDL